MNTDSSIIPTLLVDPDLALMGIILLANWKPSYPSYYFSQMTSDEARKVEKRIFNESFPYFSYTMKLLLYDKPEKAASIIQEALTWFEQKARRLSYGNSSNLLSNLLIKRELILNWLQHKLTDCNLSSLEMMLPQYWSKLLVENLDKEKNPIEHPSLPQLLWLIQLHRIERPSLQEEIIIQALIRYYDRTQQFCRDGWIWSDRIGAVMSDQGWNIVIKWAIKQADDESNYNWLRTLLYPINIQELIKELPQEEDKQYSWNRMASDRIAVHLSFLARNIVCLQNIQDSNGFQMLVVAFNALLLKSFKKHGKVIFHPFDESLGYIPPLSRKETNILETIVEAINIQQDEIRKKILLDIINNNRDPGLLSAIFNRLDRKKDRNIVLSVLSDHTKITGSDVSWISGLKSIVTELLNTNNLELADLAQNYLDRICSNASPKVLKEYGDWIFREKLRIYFLRKNYEEILHYDLQEVIGNKANILTFYQALTQMETIPADLKSAITKLERLMIEDKGNLGYQVNLYAAYVRAAVESHTEGHSSLSYFLKKAEDLLLEIHSMKREFPRSLDVYVNSNRLFLAMALKEKGKFWNIYRGLDIKQQYSLPIGLYCVQILIDELNWDEAERKLKALYQWHGEFPEYEMLYRSIQERKNENSNPIPPSLLMIELFQWPSIATALNNLKNLSFEDQVRAVKGDKTYTVQDYILEIVLDICRDVLKYSPSITPSDKQQAEEDRYTDLLVLLLNQRLLPLNWSADSQSRGGYTGVLKSHRGGIGERDLIIWSREHTELAIGEALNLRGFNTADIEGHTKKIFGYDTTRCNFHIIINWGFSKSSNELWSQYKQLVVSRTKGLFPVISFGESKEMFPKHNFQGIRSFYTLHETDTMERKSLAVHLYVDVLNEKLKEIAKEARENKK